MKNNNLSQKQVYAFATNAGWLGRTFKEIENYCDVKKELNIQFAEDYREHKCLTSENEIDEWINSIKIVRKYEEKYFKESIKMALNESEFISRVGLVIILNYFISKDNLNGIFDTLDKIQSEKFYINMAEAWLICKKCYC